MNRTPLRHLHQRGFTLIELLVVISIMALLSSLVLVTLNRARINSANNAVEAQLSAMRTEAGIYYLNNATYDGLCANDSVSARIFASAATEAARGAAADGICLSSGTTELDYSSAGVVSASKASTPGKWAVSMRLQDGTYFCVDYTGAQQTQPSRGLSSSPVDMLCN